MHLAELGSVSIELLSPDVAALLRFRCTYVIVWLRVFQATG